ncbi:MAG: hypothetical protein COT71_04000 [Candidatus Andersenbacteria bacterium CG10_big_fil_rev_8_21_14_0_10_54_11]|uniref:Ribosomal subunit interface protein n=1 Tax=Candidatus Andersenbacteria bacterium CG10_big_fil_rev_8_21_14_0_10_54_11 TaxID=1974485 RepID=A0A2M6WYG7_9BACT|nr:MAG: hypothetical protein COT71_04000 [Candidatus Andersenbacteria bacterium CG10_big_fil_rev_8_21_14_0_10_54_11]
MRFSLTLQHLTLSDFDRAQLDSKFQRLEKHVVPPFKLDVVLCHAMHHQNGPVVVCRLNLTQGGIVFHADREAATALSAVDAGIEALYQELQKIKQKQRRWRRGWKRIFRRE